ncbi:YceI family protein [Actibacterium sp. 188UL27-1]|uniref:YceI family protein n=1 Tax=Actibacterium sp. 188UL27-1 TaxID=2786961 RepID=UPI00195A78C1|nr:YceI family protein [Actibacterium sp. 188UL27-1]MBM7069229.1 YceI family protein [Actibacterium sp. 188UL27-1]
MISVLRIVLLLLFVGSAPAAAAPSEYALDPGQSAVGFTYTFEGRDIQGQMPITRADLTVDFNNLSASTAVVELNVAKARAGFVFATQAMRGPKVLDSGRHPRIRFVSNRFTRAGRGAVVDGRLTIRGVTRPVRLNARFFRTPETDPADLQTLDILLSGSVDRNAFGASGFRSYVGPKIDIRIKARITKR